MPQPFKGTCNYNLFSLRERPKLAHHVGLIASMWSLVDLQLAHMFSIMMHADAEIGTTILSVIRSEPVKIAAIQAVAEEKLSGELLAEYGLLMKSFKSTSSARNDVVHKIWAVPEDQPDSLVLMDSRKASLFNASLISSFAKPFGPQDHERQTRALDEYLHASMEFKENDFLEIEKRIEDLSKKINDFSNKLQQPTQWQIALAEKDAGLK